MEKRDVLEGIVVGEELVYFSWLVKWASTIDAERSFVRIREPGLGPDVFPIANIPKSTSIMFFYS